METISDMKNEIAFEMAVSSVRFGAGVTREVGMDLQDLGARNVLVVTDPLLAQMRPVQTVLESLQDNGISFVLYDRVRVEPTDESFLDAIAFARPSQYDAFVAVGGGSVIDTAKAVNLYTTYPPTDFLDYVNPPIGKGMPVPGSAEALDRRSHHGGHRQRNHGRKHFRSEPDARQDRHRQPASETNVGASGSRKYPHDAAAGGRFKRSRYSEPRHRILYSNTLHREASPGAAHASPGLSRIESDQRHLVSPSHADGEPVSGSGGRGPSGR